jgi:hypothetical protein
MPKTDTANHYETRKLFWPVRSAILLDALNKFSYITFFNIHQIKSRIKATKNILRS